MKKTADNQRPMFSGELKTLPPVPPVTTVATCSSCNASIRFFQRVAGAPTPFDLAPRPEGTHVYVGDGWVMTIKQAVENGYDVSAGEQLVTHFATCPNAKAHRKDGR